MDFIRDLAVVMVVAGAVGWICRRIGLSVVVGYLAAGIIIGPYTPPFQLVSNLDRVQALAQFGLVFLVFSIGMGLSLGRLQRLGFSLALATFISAMLVLNLCRLFGLGLGWPPLQGLFLAGMLMVSSSAIISKVLEEVNASHERAGQLALGVTVLEDVVAIVMLTLLTSIVQIGGQQTATVWPIVGKLSAFVVFLVFLSLLAVPNLLSRLTSEGSEELRTIIMTGLLLTLAWLASSVGYSMALGAFILGAIVAGTRFKADVERAFDTMRHIFGAVFFVAIGMLFDFRLLAQAWPLVLGATGLALIGRPLACALGLIAVGNRNRESIQASLALVPIGEFSFVIAQLGVDEGKVPASFYAVAVGVCLTTSLAAPLLIRHSEALSNWMVDHEPKFLREWISFYRGWLGQLQVRQDASRIWNLVRKRILLVALYLLFITALLLFWRPLYNLLESGVGRDWLFPRSLLVLFWIIFGMVLLGPLNAIWRNLEVVIMVLAEGAIADSPRHRLLRPLLEGALKTVGGVLLGFWLLSLLPLAGASVGILGLVIAMLVVFAALFSRRIYRWHSRVENELRQQFKSASNPAALAGLSLPILEQPDTWNLDTGEVNLPAQSPHAGKTIQELALRQQAGCSIVGIDRQGFVISNPSGKETLYPGDRLLLLGAAAQLAAAERLLTSCAPSNHHGQSFSELTTETVVVPQDSSNANQTLLELDLIRRFSVQVCGIESNGHRLITPTGKDKVRPGDRLLLMGTHDRIQECARWFDTSTLTPSSDSLPP